MCVYPRTLAISGVSANFTTNTTHDTKLAVRQSTSFLTSAHHGIASRWRVLIKIYTFRSCRGHKRRGFAASFRRQNKAKEDVKLESDVSVGQYGWVLEFGEPPRKLASPETGRHGDHVPNGVPRVLMDGRPRCVTSERFKKWTQQLRGSGSAKTAGNLGKHDSLIDNSGICCSSFIFCFEPFSGTLINILPARVFSV